MDTSNVSNTRRVMAPANHGARRGERGASLAETLVAVVVLGLLGATLFGGYNVAIGSGEINRAGAANTVALRNAVDVLTEATYHGCGTVADYQAALDAGPAFEAATVTVTKVEYWNLGSTTPAAFRTGACNPALAPPAAGGDSGLQRITYDVTASRGSRQFNRDRSILKRSNAAYAEPPADPPPGGYTCTVSADADPSQLRTNWVNQFAGQRDAVHAGDDHMDILYLNGSRRFSYLWFKIDQSTTCNEGGSLGADRTILSARLELYTYKIGGLPACGAGSCWHALERVNGTWNPAALTWNNQPCTGQNAVKLTSCRPDGQPGVLFEHGGGNRSARYQRIEATMLTNDVRDFYADGAQNNGWVIREACDGGAGPYNKACGTISPGFQFRSKAASTSSQRPRLVVVYQ